LFAFAVRRLLVSIPVFLLSTFLVFLLVAYGADPLAQFKARNPPPSQATLNALANQLYLNHGLLDRYWHWLTQLILHGNWGPSINTATDIGQLLRSSLTLTLRLVVLAMVVAVFFAIIDLVAGVGLWLAAPWGAVVWLTSVISMAAVELLFPQIYGGNMWVVVMDVLLLGMYLGLSLMAARQQPG